MLFLSLIFIGLIMMFLCVHLFEFNLLGFCWASGIYKYTCTYMYINCTKRFHDDVSIHDIIYTLIIFIHSITLSCLSFPITNSPFCFFLLMYKIMGFMLTFSCLRTVYLDHGHPHHALLSHSLFPLIPPPLNSSTFCFQWVETFAS
jgi:hypothetical protein